MGSESDSLSWRHLCSTKVRPRQSEDCVTHCYGDYYIPLRLRERNYRGHRSNNPKRTRLGESKSTIAFSLARNASYVRDDLLVNLDVERLADQSLNVSARGYKERLSAECFRREMHGKACSGHKTDVLHRCFVK